MHSNDAENPDHVPQPPDDEAPSLDIPEAPAPDAAAAEIADLKDKLLRTLAESENMRRRFQKEREDTSKYAIAGFARDMLTVADNLRRALDAAAGADDNARAVIEGVEMTEREMLAALERHGIRRIDPMGQKFNHEQHEAMFEVPTADAPPGTVMQVLEVGYMIHDRLLRPARVGIAKATPGGAAQPKVDTVV
ncbi:MAG: nucleotide exchange factor GrpE [Rhodospirillales bacterium]